MLTRASFTFVGLLFALGSLFIGIFGSVASAYMGAALLAAIQAPAREAQQGRSPARSLSYVLMALALLLAAGHLWLGVPITEVPGRSLSMGGLILGAMLLAPAYALGFSLTIRAVVRVFSKQPSVAQPESEANTAYSLYAANTARALYERRALDPLPPLPAVDLIDIGHIDGRRMALAKAPATESDIRAWLLHARRFDEADQRLDAPTAATSISWESAVAYADWMCRKTGLRYRLPTEAEWLAAAACATGTPFAPSAPLRPSVAANLAHPGLKLSNLFQGPSAPGTYPADPAGFHDLFGNVWTPTLTAASDWVPSDGKLPQFLAKGGSWFTRVADASSESVRAMRPTEHHADTGVRLACEIEGSALEDSADALWAKRVLGIADARYAGLSVEDAKAMLSATLPLFRQGLVAEVAARMITGNPESWGAEERLDVLLHAIEVDPSCEQALPAKIVDSWLEDKARTKN